MKVINFNLKFRSKKKHQKSPELIDPSRPPEEKIEQVVYRSAGDDQLTDILFGLRVKAPNNGKGAIILSAEEMQVAVLMDIREELKKHTEILTEIRDRQPRLRKV